MLENLYLISSKRKVNRSQIVTSVSLLQQGRIFFLRSRRIRKETQNHDNGLRSQESLDRQYPTHSYLYFLSYDIIYCQNIIRNTWLIMFNNYMSMQFKNAVKV